MLTAPHAVHTLRSPGPATTRREDIHWLQTQGYRSDEAKTTLFTGSAKSVIRPDFERRLSLATGGQVAVCQGRAFAETAHPGQLSPRGKGNPKHKPLIEGLWCVVENAQ